MSIKYLDYFAGVGGFHSAFSRVGWDFKGFCEIDQFARQSYKSIYDTENGKEWHDITTVPDDEFESLSASVDLLAGGFPCQPFSVSGKRAGFEDSRGTLFFEVARAARLIRPKYILLENVKGLLNHDKGNTVFVILRTLSELGYVVDFEILNSNRFGIPHNRERIFILAAREDLVDSTPWKTKGKGSVAIAKKLYGADELIKPFNFFEWYSNHHVRPCEIKDLLETSPDEKYFIDPKELEGFVEVFEDHVTIREATKKGYAVAYPGDTINLSQPNSKTRRGRVGRKQANTLLTGQEQSIVLQTDEGIKIRRLTPLESWRLQDFTDEQFYKAQSNGLSDYQLYKQAGNSVTVAVVEAIATYINELDKKIKRESKYAALV